MYEIMLHSTFIALLFYSTKLLFAILATLPRDVKSCYG